MSDNTTPRPWRKKRAPLDADDPAAPPVGWEIVAGTFKTRKNQGHFHPEDATYTVDEFDIVSLAYDRDYGYPEGAISNEADADLIVRAVNDHDVLVAIAEAAEAGVLAWEAKCAELAPGKDPWGMATLESRALVEALAVWRERKEQR